MVAVRACGIGRPIARYFERLESHDLAFRVLARMRGTFFRGLEPQVPARIEGYRRGDLLARMVDDVDAMQNLFLRGITPPLVAIVAGGISVVIAALFVPAAGAILALGLVVGGVGVPALAAVAGGRAERGRAALRAELTAEIVDLLRGAPELVVFGADRAAIEAGPAAGRRAGAASGPGRGGRRRRRGAGDRRCRPDGRRRAGGLRARDGDGIARPRARARRSRSSRWPRSRRRPAAGGRAPTPRDPRVGAARAGDRRRDPRRRSSPPTPAGLPEDPTVALDGVGFAYADGGVLGAPRRGPAARARTVARARRPLRGRGRARWRR